MSKQANEKLHTRLVEISTSYGSYIMLDKTLWPKMFEAIEKYVSRNYTPNSVVEQRCLEARLDELKSVYKASPDALFEYDDEARVLVLTRTKDLEAQLTNLQNKEDE